jgi:uncharacterized protein (DUF433 family)
MEREYIERRQGGYYLMGSRVSLDSVVYEFFKGETPEGILQSFPSLSLEQVYGGITYYLAHRATIANPLLYAKLESARRALPTRS